MDTSTMIVGFALSVPLVVALAIVLVVRLTNCTVREAAEAIGGVFDSLGDVVRSVGHAIRGALPGGKCDD
jgi:hypothetical protein